MDRINVKAKNDNYTYLFDTCQISLGMSWTKGSHI